MTSFFSIFRPRHGIACAVILGVALFGKNNNLQFQYSQYDLDRALSQYSISTALPYINKSIPEYILGTIPETGIAPYYRVIFLAQYNPTNTNHESQIEDQLNASNTFSIRQRDPISGSEVEVKQFTIQRGYAFQMFSLSLDHPSAGQQIIAHNLSSNYSPVYFDQINLIPVDSQLAIQSATQLGTIAYPIIFNTLRETVGKTVYVDSKQAAIGQIFEANSPYLSSIDLVPNIEGQGGNGKYHLEIRPVSKNDAGKYVISPTVLAAHDLYIREMQQTESRTKDAITYWHIPLTAHLQIGSLYYVGISNNGVRSTFFDRLGFRLSSDQSSFPSVKNIQSDTISSTPMAIRIYGATENEAFHTKLPAGAVIQQISDHQSLYTFSTKGQFSDILTLDHDAVLANQAKGSIFFDSIRKAIVGSGNGDLSIPFVFNTGYPIRKVNLSVCRAQDLQNLSLRYSYDGATWSTLDSVSIESAGCIAASLKSTSSATTLYLQIGRGKLNPDINYTAFGFNSISVQINSEVP
jgi:hypothetical protein